MSDKCVFGCGVLFIISAPSGVGKTTIANHIINNVPKIKQSVSCTTRAARAGEVNGTDYNFIAKEEFKKMVAENAFLEYAEVHGNYYGTTSKSVADAAAKQEDLLLVIDVQGSKQISDKDVDSVSIFMLPPSMEELSHRLAERATEATAIMNKRIATAKEEIAKCREYDYIVVNDDLHTAKQVIAGIIMAERSRANRTNITMPDYELPPRK